MKRIKMFDYLRQYENIKREILEAIERVLNSGQLILGPEVHQFEKSFLEFLGMEKSGGCVGVKNGTDALVVALMALGVGYGDEVITVANTAVPNTSSTIVPAAATHARESEGMGRSGIVIDVLKGFSIN